MLKNQLALKPHKYAHIFAALGDETRLLLVVKLAEGTPRSISDLTEGSKLTRQAVTKHLRVLESAGIVHSTKTGRESQFALEDEPFKDMEEYLGFVSEQWDSSLARLKSFVEK